MQPRERTVKRLRRCRPSLENWLRSDREIQWRLAAGLILLSGVISLTASFNWFGGEANVERIVAAAVDAATVGGIRRNMMEQPQETVGTVDRPFGVTIGSRLPPGSEPIAEPAAFEPEEHEYQYRGAVESSRLWPSSLLDDIESVIQRYPWPTLFLGMGVGYLLARRVR